MKELDQNKEELRKMKDHLTVNLKKWKKKIVDHQKLSLQEKLELVSFS